MADVRMHIDKSVPAMWGVSFDNPPINLIDPPMIVQLGEIVDEMENDPNLKVVVFRSADPAFYLAHIDVTGDYASMKPGKTGMHPWLDVLVRLSRAPVGRSPRSEGARVARAANSGCPATSASLRGRRRSWDNLRWDWAPFPGAIL